MKTFTLTVNVEHSTPERNERLVRRNAERFAYEAKQRGAAQAKLPRLYKTQSDEFDKWALPNDEYFHGERRHEQVERLSPEDQCLTGGLPTEWPEQAQQWLTPEELERYDDLILYALAMDESLKDEDPNPFKKVEEYEDESDKLSQFMEAFEELE